jgi:hypothetical protein
MLKQLNLNGMIFVQAGIDKIFLNHKVIIQ